MLLLTALKSNFILMKVKVTLETDYAAKKVQEGFLQKLDKERNMITGKYTYIDNMIPWSSSRNILCLLKN